MFSPLTDNPKTSVIIAFLTGLSTSIYDHLNEVKDIGYSIQTVSVSTEALEERVDEIKSDYSSLEWKLDLQNTKMEKNHNQILTLLLKMEK